MLDSVWLTPKLTERSDGRLVFKSGNGMGKNGKRYVAIAVGDTLVAFALP
jgi:hypothetical protein